MKRAMIFTLCAAFSLFLGLATQPAAYAGERVPLHDSLISNSMGAYVVFVGTVLVLAFYLIAWNKVGKDPRKGTVVVQYAPPDGLSPAAVRYIRRMGYDDKVLAANLMDLSAKGLITIEQEGSTYTLTSGGKRREGLTADQEKIAFLLNRAANGLKVDGSNGFTLSKAAKDLKADLEERYQGKLFARNGRYLIPGAVASAVLILLGAYLTKHDSTVIGMAIWLAIWTPLAYGMLAGTLIAWGMALRSRGKDRGPAWGAVLFFTLFGLPFVGGELLGIRQFAELAGCALPTAVGLLAMVNFVFYNLLKVYTREGRTVADRIEGFRMYLAAVERDYLSTTNQPDKTPELFEKYLPYATALDCKSAWAAQFADVVTDAAREARG